MDELRNGERQVAPTVAEIRRDHVARYEWAAGQLPRNSYILDAACGVGYGAWILAQAGHQVLAIDRSAAAIAYAKENYASPRIDFIVADVDALDFTAKFDAAVTFETIEHLQDPSPFLAALRRCAPILFASVPNEAGFPFLSADNEFRGWAHHFRHYSAADLEQLLARHGWRPQSWLAQLGRDSDLEPLEGDLGDRARTIVVAAEAVGIPLAEAAPIVLPQAPPPEHVAIVGLGPSAKEYFELVKRLGGRKALADETWAINGLGDVIACDRIFHMDDLLVQEARAEARPDSNIARMVDWLKSHPGPIYTSVVRPGYPGLVPFPLEDVLNNGGVPYFNNTVAYAIAYARHIGVKKLSIYGADFTRPNVHRGEQGRACCEFWLGLCTASGMEIVLPSETTLMDACAGDGELFYGYDGVEVHLRDGEAGRLIVDMIPKALPTAAEIEQRYDHSRHPNRLMRGERT